MADNSDEKRKWVRLTRVCNNHCLFCLDSERQNGSFLPFSSILKNLSDGLKKGCKRAVLSGGEPSIHPDFIKVVRSAHALGYSSIQVITNGRMFCYPEYLREAVSSGLTEITFSIHSHLPEINDYLTGVKGSLIQSVKALKNAMSVPGLIVNCDIVVSKLNINSLAQHLRFLFKLGIREFDVLNLIPFGRAWENWDKLYYDVFQHKDDLFNAFEIRFNNGVHLWTNRFPPDLFVDTADLIQSPFKLIDEIMGWKEDFDYIRQNKEKKMWCEGERCRYCILQPFCRDYRKLIEYGKLLSHNLPLCLENKNTEYNTSEDQNFVLSSDELEKIATFFIKERHFFKGQKCVKCRHFDSCSGVPLLYIKSNGFNSVIPIEK